MFAKHIFLRLCLATKSPTTDALSLVRGNCRLLTGNTNTNNVIIFHRRFAADNFLCFQSGAKNTYNSEPKLLKIFFIYYYFTATSGHINSVISNILYN